MVLVAIDDPAASTAIWKLCREKRIPANIADVPSECDFYFGSTHRDGPLQIMVSTNGKGPRLASSIRKFIGGQLPKNVGNAIETIGELRVKLRKLAPNIEDGPKRMAWFVHLKTCRHAWLSSLLPNQKLTLCRMTKVSDAYTWEEMCDLTDEDLDNLLRFYEKNKVPAMDVLMSMRGQSGLESIDLFDGSFGFSIGV